MDSHALVPVNPPEMEAEQLSEAEAEAIKAKSARGRRGPMSVDEAHLHMSLLIRRMKRGRVPKEEGNLMLNAYRKLVEVADKVEEARDRQEFLEALRRGEIAGPGMPV